MDQWLDFSPEVKEAKQEGMPLVALESTMISHGMPYPQNVETAKAVERIIRENGAVPATIGIMDGKVKIGLTDSELEFFGTSREISKVSRRDFPIIIPLFTFEGEKIR